jgi:hypothetical protein
MNTIQRRSGERYAVMHPVHTSAHVHTCFSRHAKVNSTALWKEKHVHSWCKIDRRGERVISHDVRGVYTVLHFGKFCLNSIRKIPPQATGFTVSLSGVCCTSNEFRSKFPDSPHNYRRVFLSVAGSCRRCSAQPIVVRQGDLWWNNGVWETPSSFKYKVNPSSNCGAGPGNVLRPTGITAEHTVTYAFVR